MKTATPVQVYLRALNKNITGLDPGVSVHACERFELAAIGVRGERSLSLPQELCWSLSTAEPDRV